MFIPPNCETLDKIDERPQIRLGIQGYGGTGKTTSAMTFLNPVVANLERGLGAFAGRKDIVEAKFWDLKFCKSVNPNHKTKADLRDTIMIWLNKDATKLEPDQTLVFDGGTTAQNAYHAWYALNPVYTKAGKEDDYAEWRLKINFFSELCETFKLLKCDVVYICHEADKKDKDGNYSGKIRPLLSGQFNDQIINYFTDWFRQRCCDKIVPDKIDQKVLTYWGCASKEEFIELQDEFTKNTLYFWQTEGDDIFDAKASSLLNAPRFIPASFKYFSKYMKNKDEELSKETLAIAETLSIVK